MFGFYRLASVIGRVGVADVAGNCENIIKLSHEAAANGAAVVVFSELSLSSCSCKDLFFQPSLHVELQSSIIKIAEATQNLQSVLVFGMPFLHQDKLYNTAIVLQQGKILAIVPKQNLPNYREFNEKRYFESGKNLQDCVVDFANQEVPFGKSFIFEREDFNFGLEICEDFWSLIPPSTALIGNGAK